MLFREELAIKVARGEKTATRRLAKDNPRSPWWFRECRYKVGDEFPVMGGFHRPAFCRAIVDRVAYEQVGGLGLRASQQEGFETEADFLAKFREINGEVPLSTWVWVVEFHVDPGTVAL
jgi:hypothetical protein